MKFNVAKCEVMRLSRHRQAMMISHNYLLHGQVLYVVVSAKYLGVTLTNTLDWSKHIDSVTSKANRTLGFIRRNLSFAPQVTRLTAYKTLVRPQAEHASPVWNPYARHNIHRTEKEQCTTARWACRRFRRSSNVDDMLPDLVWIVWSKEEKFQALLFCKNNLYIDKEKFLTPAISRSLRTRHSHPFQYYRPLHSLFQVFILSLVNISLE
ncbi:hypothetical protein ACF0H5_010121 [Mactra antiquata]